MTRRLTIAIVGVVAGALLLAGLGTLLLVVVSSRAETRQGLTRDAIDVAESVRLLGTAERRAIATDTTGTAGARTRPVIQALRRALRLQGAELVTFGPAGNTTDTLPAGVSVADLDLTALRNGEVVSGTHGGLVYAAAPVREARLLSVVVLTRKADSGIRSGGRWFALAAVVTLLAAIAVAGVLGARLTRPVRAAEATAHRIAAGDLTARVPDPGGGDELADLARSINTMAAELERSQGLERQFLLSVSHDLRTPLTSIRGFAEAIAEGAAPDHEKAAAVISAEARRLERLVRDLLDLAKLDARRFSLDLSATDVAEVVGETAEGFRPAADDAGVALTVEVAAASDVPARADADRLAQVVANLVENALKYAASGIRVGATATDGRLVVWVDDDGPGIAPGDLPRVFDRLYTSARTPARQGTGSGLGLAIVRELVDAMGGSVRAESQGAGGTRMVVTLRAWSSSPAAAASST